MTKQTHTSRDHFRRGAQAEDLCKSVEACAQKIASFCLFDIIAHHFNCTPSFIITGIAFWCSKLTQTKKKGHFAFFFLGGGGVTIFFYSIVPGVMLSTNAMFKSALHIHTVVI